MVDCCGVFDVQIPIELLGLERDFQNIRVASRVGRERDNSGFALLERAWTTSCAKGFWLRTDDVFVNVVCVLSADDLEVRVRAALVKTKRLVATDNTYSKETYLEIVKANEPLDSSSWDDMACV
jgi:hypothetical protein